MIVSASRRTDIPAYYLDWFLNRLREGKVLVKNPMNPRQVSRIALNRGTVDGIVFWSKNPAPMTRRLGELSEWPWYLQFTLTGYGRDIEPGLPDKQRELIPLFQSLSERAGSKRMVWRYDPILISGQYPVTYHIEAFQAIAEKLKGCTDQAVISFLDSYGKTKRNLRGTGCREPEPEEMEELARALGSLAARNGMRASACAEAADLSGAGIGRAACIDRERMERICGYPLKGGRDRNQRPECGCMESVDIGAYDTCPSGCRYCYANDSAGSVAKRRREFCRGSELLCSRLSEGDRVTDRKVRLLGACLPPSGDHKTKPRKA